MTKPDKKQTSSVIRDAIREKRERKPIDIADIDALEASLLADIEAFDLDAAERLARREQMASEVAGLHNADLAFPEIVPAIPPCKPAASEVQNVPPPISDVPKGGSGLLGKLRYQAELQQRDEHSAQLQRTESNKIIDQALKHVFFYLHDLVQQLNILKPGIPRVYSMPDGLTLGGFAWQEGFADYRTQAQSAGALVELVSFSTQLYSPACLVVERDGPSVERFRRALFDFGLQFSCKDFKNERQFIERAEFQITNQLSVNARWKADFERGLIIFEARNLERLGPTELSIRPAVIDYPLLEEFGRLVLGQANRFREFTKR
ncbi:MAG: hypothetical protein ABTQ26_14040 [Azonexus sp.]